MILVTGAAGKTGLAVIRAVVSRNVAVRALVRDDAQRRRVAALGVVDSVLGDMREHAVVRRALTGATSLYLICPNMAEDELQIAKTAVSESRSAGVRRVVYHSVLHPQLEAMPHHWQKLRAEEHLVGAGLPYTILQPAAYMQNVLASLADVESRGLYRVPYAAETRLGMVDLADVAEVAATVLVDAGHEGATYALAGPEVMTQSEIADAIGRAIGRSVAAASVSPEQWETDARAHGLTNEYAITSLLAMFRYYERHGFAGNSRILELLLGRPPTRFAAFLRRSLDAR